MTLFNRIGIAVKAIVSQTPSKAARPQRRSLLVIQDSRAEDNRSAAISLGAGRALYCPVAKGSDAEYRDARMSCIYERWRYFNSRMKHVRRLQAALERCDDPKIEAEVVIPQIMMVYGEMLDQKLIDDRKPRQASMKSSYLMALELLHTMKKACATRIDDLSARFYSMEEDISKDRSKETRVATSHIRNVSR